MAERLAIREQAAEEKRFAHENTKDSLKEQIDRHEVISFDIFDTLLCRKVWEAEDVFELVNARALEEGMRLTDFRACRIRAQDELGLTNPDLKKIYDNFQKITGVDDLVRKRLIQLELETEFSVLIPREAMMDIYRYALEKKKRVYLVSDMYLTQSMLKKILEKNRISSYEKVIVSCECKKLKMQGLFEELLKSEKERKILHIGDHEIYDGVCAKEMGIDTFLVCTPKELLNRSSWSELLYERPQYMNDRSLIGLSISCMFNDPFKLSGGRKLPQVSDCYQMGYVLIAPIITVFMNWFLKKIKNRGYDAILFAARDGFLIQKLYNSAVKALKWFDMPDGIYFQTSRKAAVNSDMTNEAVINMLIGMRDILSPEEVLVQLFGLKREEIEAFQEDEDWDIEIYKYVWKHKEQIFQKSSEMRHSYFKYMGQLGLKIGGKYAFYDFVSSGTCQKALAKLIPFELNGLYFGWNSDEDMGDYSIEAMMTAGESFFMKYYKMLELFLTSDKPSLDGFDGSGRPILTQELRTKEEIERILTVQKAIADYFEEYITNLYISDGEMNLKWADRILNCMVEIDASNLDYDLYDLILTDDWNRMSRELRELVT